MELQKRKGKEDYPITTSDSGKYKYIEVPVRIRLDVDSNQIMIDDQQGNKSFWGTVTKNTSLYEQLNRLFNK
ncbi:MULTISPECIES: hypothetical protein [Priestia]|uniref:hypothetical protein n=1 Tax=Priestia TaxID=2800373 RepID=UPI0011286D8E|nr:MULTISPECIES: hypothetical protein [Priestia]